MRKRDEFETTGEVVGYISLDQALLKAKEIALQDETRYMQRLGWEEVAWAEKSADHREDTYRIELWFWDPGLRSQLRSAAERDKHRGYEEFVFDLFGNLKLRQTLGWPETTVTVANARWDSTAGVHPSGRRTESEKGQRRRSSHVDELKPVFWVSREAAQFYMDEFILARGETVLVDVPVEIPRRSFLGIPTGSATDTIGITNWRILFPTKLPERECFLPNCVAVRGRPGPRGIEIEWESTRHERHTARIFLQTDEYRDALVEAILELVDLATPKPRRR